MCNYIHIYRQDDVHPHVGGPAEERRGCSGGGGGRRRARVRARRSSTECEFQAAKDLTQVSRHCASASAQEDPRGVHPPAVHQRCDATHGYRPCHRQRGADAVRR